MRVPDTVREAAREAARQAAQGKSGELLVGAVVNAVIQVIEDHPDMLPSAKVPDGNVVHENIFEEKDPPRFFQ